MSEAAFPLLGAAIVVLIVLPLFAVVAKAGLMLLERDELSGPLHGLNLRYVVLAASSAIPLAWFLSAGLHQAETGKSVLACLLDHGEAALCLEPGFFALVLTVLATGAWLRTTRRRALVQPSSSRLAAEANRRIQVLIDANPALAGLRGRIVTTDQAGFAIGTRGLLRRRVFVGSTFAADLSDPMLVGALAHESGHVRSLDPLRYLLLEIALGVNPFGRALLAPHVQRWKAAREVHCDREAVLAGASPLALAEAIVRAARPATPESVGLGTDDVALLKFRVAMLVAFAERAPHRCCGEGRSTIPVAIAILAIALLLPHQTGTGALDALHVGVEHAVAYFSN